MPYHGCQLLKEPLMPHGLPGNTSEYLRRHLPRQHTAGFVRRAHSHTSVLTAMLILALLVEYLHKTNSYSRKASLCLLVNFALAILNCTKMTCMPQHTAALTRVCSFKTKFSKGLALIPQIHSKAWFDCNAGRNLNQTTFLRAQSVSGVKMLISTYVPQAHCNTHEGTQIAQMSVLNKHDYAHWNNYMFRLETTTADPSLAPKGSPDVSYSSI